MLIEDMLKNCRPLGSTKFKLFNPLTDVSASAQSGSGLHG
jgi:hypothetical protein